MPDDKELWWGTIPGAVRLTKETAATLLRGETAVLYEEDRFPWMDEFRLNVKDQVQKVRREYQMETCDASQMEGAEPAEWILKEFGSGIFRLPSEAPDQCALKHDLLKSRIFWVTGCTVKKQVRAWAELGRFMQKNPEKGGCVALVVPRSLQYSGLRGLEVTSFARTYDLTLFASSLIAQTSLGEFDKKYLTELAVSLSGGSPERCAILAARQKSLLQKPLEGPFPETCTPHNVWSAQMNTVFAAMEAAKIEILEDNASAVEPLIGYTDDYGNQISGLGDLELRHVIYAHNHKRISLPQNAVKRLNVMLEARNQLAHHKTLTYKQMLKVAEIL